MSYVQVTVCYSHMYTDSTAFLHTVMCSILNHDMWLGYSKNGPSGHIKFYHIFQIVAL